MIRGTRRTLRYAHSWLTGRAAVEEEEVRVDRGDRQVPGTLLLPRNGTPPFPAWIVLHGITRPGRRHPELVRFARALAASRAAVLIPEVPEWIDLELAPEPTLPTVRGSLAVIASRHHVRPHPVGLIGFSFGAPQAVLLSSAPGIRERIGAVVGFGGYCDLERTLRFQFTGHHEWDGVTRRLDPDPYGRWIVGANYLPGIPGHGDAEDVARALRTLAADAGDRGVVAWDPAYEPLKRKLRAGVGAPRRELFDLFAPPDGGRPEPDQVEPLVSALATEARRRSAALEPAPHLDAVTRPVQLLHGRGDRLIPFTESLRLARRLPDRVDARTTVTGLFAHSGQDPLPGFLARLREGAVFVGALRNVLGAL